MKTIALTQGRTAMLDDADLEIISGSKWHFANTGYAATRRNNQTVLMHRLLLGARPGQEIDHIDGNRLNNCRSNLRFASHAQNSRNRNKHIRNISGFKGVCPGPNGKWKAEVRVNGKKLYLGLFEVPSVAAMAYDTAARIYHGDFARLNFPE